VHFRHLILLENFLLLDAATQGASIGAAFFLRQRGAFIDFILGWPVELLLKDRVLVNCLELGLEVTQNLVATIGSTTLVGEIISIVLRLLAISTPYGLVSMRQLFKWMDIVDLPIAFATTFLLDLLWIHVNVTRFGKVAWEVVFRGCSAISEAAVVAIIVLLSTSH
jgi:hypothetical protein